MVTREELLHGVVKVNNERINSKVVAQTVPQEVSGHAKEGADQRAGGSGAHEEAKEVPVPGAKANLADYLAARKADRVQALVEVDDELDKHAVAIKGLNDERRDITLELHMIDRALEEVEKHGSKADRTSG